MADNKILNTTIVLRNDETANWQKETAYKLLKGEVGLEMLDNGKVKMKVGLNDGETAWADLPYVGSDEAQVHQVSSLDELEAKSAAIGDIGIVKEVVANEEIYTAYVYNGSKWTAMNGNYNAENVFVSNDLTLAGNFNTIGNYSKGETIKAGTSLQDILSTMLQQELYPTSTMPTLEISASGGSNEVGSSYTVPTATLKITSIGSYTYGPDTGVTFGIGNVKLAEGAVPADATNYKTNTNVMALNSTMTLKASGDTVLYTDTPKSYTFSAAGTCTEGATPKTNLGKDYDADGSLDVKILSEIIEAADKTVTFTGYRYGFAGGTSANSIDSAIVRSMSAKKSSRPTNSSNALTFTANKGATKVFFAYPSTWTGTPYFEMFGLAWAENINFVAKDTIQVADYRGTNEDGTLNGAAEYKLYTWELDTPLAAETTQFRVWFK